MKKFLKVLIIGAENVIMDKSTVHRVTIITR
jgi:hypothetical protein